MSTWTASARTLGVRVPGGGTPSGEGLVRAVAAAVDPLVPRAGRMMAREAGEARHARLNCL